MQVWNLSAANLREIADMLDLDLDNVRPVGRSIAFRVIPKSSRAKYARMSAPLSYHGGKGKRLRATCYHGFRDAIKRMFYNGATRVQSAQGNWTSLDGFNADLRRLYQINAGSQGRPCWFGTLCKCTEDANQILGLARVHHSFTDANGNWI